MSVNAKPTSLKNKWWQHFLLLSPCGSNFQQLLIHITQYGTVFYCLSLEVWLKFPVPMALDLTQCGTKCLFFIPFRKCLKIRQKLHRGDKVCTKNFKNLKLTNELFFTPCQCQMSISQNRSGQLVPVLLECIIYETVGKLSI